MAGPNQVNRTQNNGGRQYAPHSHAETVYQWAFKMRPEFMRSYTGGKAAWMKAYQAAIKDKHISRNEFAQLLGLRTVTRNFWMRFTGTQNGNAQVHQDKLSERLDIARYSIIQGASTLKEYAGHDNFVDIPLDTAGNWVRRLNITWEMLAKNPVLQQAYYSARALLGLGQFRGEKKGAIKFKEHPLLAAYMGMDLCYQLYEDADRNGYGDAVRKVLSGLSDRPLLRHLTYRLFRSYANEGGKVPKKAWEKLLNLQRNEDAFHAFLKNNNLIGHFKQAFNGQRVFNPNARHESGVTAGEYLLRNFQSMGPEGVKKFMSDPRYQRQVITPAAALRPAQTGVGLLDFRRVSVRQA